MRNKSGKSDMSTVLMWIAIIGVIAYAANFGGFQNTVNGLFAGSDSGANADTGIDSTALVQCPTDGTSTYTLNVQDELTTTATDVDSEYFVYNGNKLITSGTVAGSGTFDVACGKDYDVLLINTTTTDGAYGKVVPIKARISDDTINEKLIRFGGVNILSIQNPADPDRLANTSITGGQTKSFELVFVENVTDRGYNNPIVLCEANTTSIQKIVISSFSDGVEPKKLNSIPRRINPTSAETLYAYEHPGMIVDESGPITARGTITATSTTPATTDDMTCRIIDQAMWQTANFKTSDSVAVAFPEGPENTENLNDVGGVDSSVSSFTFVHSGGY